MDFEESRKNHVIAGAFHKKILSLKDNQRKLKVLGAVARLKAPWVDIVLLGALDDSSETIREYLIREISGRETVGAELLAQRLMKPPWYARSAVLRVLGMKKIPEAVRIVATAVGDVNVDVRRSAAQCLGEIGGREVLPLLVKLAKDSNHYVKTVAEEAIGKVSNVRFS